MSGGEQEKMDKKFSRQSSVPQKGNGTESKKDNGNNNNHKFPKNKKDNGRSHDQQSSFVKRSQPTKSRFVDKRPRPRGIHNGGHRDTVTDPERTEPELGSVQSWGPKKSNVSHLLNFHFEPREMRGHDRGSGGRGGYRAKGRQTWHRGPRFNKEHYLQANFQFVVKDIGDYSTHAVDPDVLVDWDLIEQVRIHSSGQTACPICLYPPTAAKITRCGHIYCWACILHYLSLGEKAWRRCPICYDAILQKDLKSVKIIETCDYRVGETVTLKLMKRLKGSTQAMPVEQWTDREGKFYNLTDCVDTQYCKLLVVSVEEVKEIVTVERRQLQEQLKVEDEESLESSYIKAALELLKERENSVVMSAEVKEDLAKKMLQLSLEESKKVTEALNSRAQRTVTYTSAFSDDEMEEDSVETRVDSPPSVPPVDIDQYATVIDCKPREGETRSSSESSTSSGLEEDQQPHQQCTAETANEKTDPAAATVVMVTADGIQEVSITAAAEEMSMPQHSSNDGALPKRNLNCFYFFQAVDGQNMFLHSLNAQCLVKEYGSMEKCPTTITAEIVELHGVTMNEELRRRLRYLGHLPVTCEFQVAELALKLPILSEDTLRFFSDKIERKKRQRQKKQREEQRFSQRIQEAENKKMGIDPRVVIVKSDTVAVHSSTLDITPESTDCTPIGSPTDSSNATVLATSPKSVSSSDEGGQSSSMSFAQMLRAGKAKPQEAWPKAGTGPNVLTADPQTGRHKGNESDDPDTEDRVPVPGYKASFGDAIQAALDKYQETGPETGPEAPPNPNVTPNRKKKKQLKMLFSTSMNRAK